MNQSTSETFAANIAALAARGTLVPAAVAQNGLAARTSDRSVDLDGTVAAIDLFVSTAFAAGEPPAVVVVGLGAGEVLDAVARRSPRTRVLALEPSPEGLHRFLSCRRWQEWIDSGRLRILLGPEYLGASTAWQHLDGDQSQIPIVHDPVLIRVAREEAVRAHSVANQIIFGAQSNARARMLFGARYLVNTLTNLPWIARSADVSSLFGRCKGMPAIVAGAGPSLDRNLPAVRKMRDRALLIGVDTTLHPLLAAGLEPDAIVAVDPQAANARHLVGAQTRSAVLIAEASCDPQVFPDFAGRTVSFRVSDHDPWPWLSSQGVNAGKLRAWGSVLTTAFDFALALGCDPIVFVGADLAYTGNQPYCRNTVYEPDWAEYMAANGCTLEEVWRLWMRQPAATAPDIHGVEVATTRDMLAFRDWLVEQSVTAAPRTIINATGGGILTGGAITQMPVIEALANSASTGGIRLGDLVAAPMGGAGLRDAVVQLRHELADPASAPGPWTSKASASVERETLLAALDSALDRWGHA